MTEHQLPGRQADIAEATEWIKSHREGPASVMFIAGEPGIGKSELARVIRENAAAAGWNVAAVECGRASSVQPFGAVTAILSQLAFSSSLDALAGGAESPLERQELFSSVTAELADKVSASPILICVDDVHVADASSQAFFGHLLEDTRDLPVILLLTGDIRTIRSSRSMASPLATVIRAGQCRIFELKGLDAGAVAEMVKSTTGSAVSAEDLERLLRLTGGNPFFIHQLARSGRISRGEATPGEALEVTPEVRFAVLESLQELGPVTYRVLGTASMIGAEFPVEILVKSLPEMSQAEVVAALDEGIGAGIIRPWTDGSEALRFSHGLTQEILASEIPPAERISRLAHIIDVVEQRYANDLESQAAFLAGRLETLGAVAGWSKFAEYSAMAARQAMRLHAYEDAITHYRKALDVHGSAEPDALTAEIIAGLARAELHVARSASERREGSQHQRQAYELMTKLGDHRGALQVASSGEGSLASTAWNIEFLQLVADRTPTELRESAEYCLLRSRLGLAYGILKGDRFAAESHLTEADSLAAGLGDPQLRADIKSNHGSVAGFWHMDHDAGLELMQQAIELNDPAVGSLRPLADRLSILIRQAAPLAIDEGARLEALATSRRDPTYISIAVASRTMWSLVSGDLGSVLELSTQQAASGIGLGQFEAVRAIAAFELGDDDAGQQSLDRMIEQTSRREQIAALDMAVAATAIAVCNRYYSASVGVELASAWAQQISQAQANPPVVRFTATCALVLLGLEAPGDTAGLLSAHSGELVPFAPVMVDHVSGVMAINRGQSGAALPFLDAAIAAGRTKSLRFATAHALVERITANGKPDSRRAREVRSLSREMDAEGVLRRLATTTERGRRPGGLTPKEQEILVLMAQGLTNQEIADRIDRTIYNVQSHAYNIFRKLDVSNRVAAIRWATDSGLV